MCIATVYVDDAGQMENILEDVVSVQFENDSVLLTTILGEEKLLQGKIKYIDFLKHSVTIEASQTPRKTPHRGQTRRIQ